MFNSIAKKVWRDLSERKVRTLLTLVGLSVGLWGVASVAVAWKVLSTDLSENFTSTAPPAIVLNLKPQSNSNDLVPLIMGNLAMIGGIAAIENRSLVKGRIKIDRDLWVPAITWVVEDFQNMQIAKVNFESDNTASLQSGLLLERDSVVFANWKLRIQAMAEQSGENNNDPHAAHSTLSTNEIKQFGDEPIEFMFEGAQQASAILAGTVHDPAQAPSRMEKVVYAYIDSETAKKWFGGNGGLAYRLLVQVENASATASELNEIARELELKLDGLGYEIVNISFPSTTEHVHQFQMDSILFLLACVGILAFMMSTVLVLNLINGILFSQVKQIGILKSIGATTAKVAMIYLSSMLILGMLSSVIAIPLAIKTGYLIAGSLSQFLNFDILTESLPLTFTFLLILVGLTFPVLAALLPVRRWTQFSVNTALQYSEVNGSEKKSRLNRFFQKIRLTSAVEYLLPINVALGVKNCLRKPLRFLLTMTTISVGIATYLIAMNIQSSLLYTATQEEAQKRYDLLVTFEEAVDPQKVAWMNKFSIVRSAETWKTISVVMPALGSPEDRGQSSEFKNTLFEKNSDNVLPLRLVPDNSQVMRPFMLEGAWLSSIKSGVVINQRVSYLNPEYRVGNVMDLIVNDREIQVPIVGVIKEFGGASLYMNQSDLALQFPHMDERINTAFITLKNPNEKTLFDLNVLLDQHFTLAKVKISNLESAKVASRIIRGHIDVIVGVLTLLAMLMLFVATLGMSSAISTSVVERSRELGILRAIGGRPKVIAVILLSETMTLAIVGWLTAFVISQPISRFLSDYFGTALVEYPFDYLGSREGLLFSLILIVLLVVVSTVGPIYSVNRRAVRDALVYE